MPNLITDVAISELSLVFAKKDGVRYRPINPEATVLSTKAQVVEPGSLLGKYADQLTEKASSDAQGEAELQVAYSTITSVFYSAIDALYSISYAPDSFSIEARKDAVKTVIDNTLKSIKDASAVVLKAGVDHTDEIIARPPFQAPPGDHPNLPTPVLPAVPVVPETTTTETVQPIKTTSVEVPPSDVPTEAPSEGEPQRDATQIDEIKAQLATLTETVKAQGEQLIAKDAEIAAATAKAAEASSALAVAVGKAQESTTNATAPRTIQESGNTPMAVPDFKSMAVPGSSGALEAAIYAQLATGSSIQ